jgi:hypothetical protein
MFLYSKEYVWQQKMTANLGFQTTTEISSDYNKNFKNMLELNVAV